MKALQRRMRLSYHRLIRAIMQVTVYGCDDGLLFFPSLFGLSTFISKESAVPRSTVWGGKSPAKVYDSYARRAIAPSFPYQCIC